MTPVRLDPANRLDLLRGARSVGLDDVPYAEVSSHFCTSLPQRIRALPVIVFCVYLRLSRELPQDFQSKPWAGARKSASTLEATVLGNTCKDICGGSAVRVYLEILDVQPTNSTS